MLNDLLNARNDFGRTFMIAMWLLGTLAAVQVVAVGWAVVTHPLKVADGSRPPASVAAAGSGGGQVPAAMPGGDPAAIAGSGNNSGTAGGVNVPLYPVNGDATLLPVVDPAADATVPGEPGSALDTTGSDMVAAAGLDGLPDPSPTDPALLLPGPSPYPANADITGAAEIENPAHVISHPVAKRMLALALEYRASGNMQAALRALRDANTLSPNHPRVLSELASTYTQMGLDEKAAEFWRSVFVLGPERAGAFYDLADMALKGNLIEENAAVEAVLSVGDIEVIRFPKATDGEKVVLRIPVLSRPGIAPDAADMAMLVYFYDQVEGGDFVPTTATTSENFVSIPYDWLDGGIEYIEETYFQPEFTEVEKKELGERSYYGYIVELYYRDELQAVVAEPESLMSLKPGETDAGLQPGIPAVEDGGPGAELFPQPAP